MITPKQLADWQRLCELYGKYQYDFRDHPEESLTVANYAITAMPLLLAEVARLQRIEQADEWFKSLPPQEYEEFIGNTEEGVPCFRVNVRYFTVGPQDSVIDSLLESYDRRKEVES